MKFHNIEMVGPFKVQKLSTLSTHTSAASATMVYVEDEDKAYFGATDDYREIGVRHALDLRPYQMSLDDTATDVSFGDVFGMMESINFSPSGDGAVWVSAKFPENYITTDDLKVAVAYNLSGNDPSKTIRIVIEFWSVSETDTPSSGSPDVSINNDITSNASININKFDEAELTNISNSYIDAGIKDFIIKITRDISEDTYTGTFQLIGLRIYQ